MDLKNKKRLASQILKCSPKRIKFDESRLEEIKEAITNNDIRSLIKDSAIIKENARGNSRVRSNRNKAQKKKGKQKGHGSRKGKRTARLNGKLEWMNKVRAQRKLIRKLKETGKLNVTDYHEIYLKVKGGFFRSRRHIVLYIKEHGMIK
jgi:large subunit ribosomal protein L19e